MRNNLLKYLVCPVCKGDLTLLSSPSPLRGRCATKRSACLVTAEGPVGRGEGEILEGTLLCEKCQINFPIIDGIPCLIPGKVSGDKQKTSEFFEKNWIIFDTCNKKFDDLLPSYLSPLAIESFKEKVVLEAGCGSGRNLLAAARAGAKEVIGIDISGSVKLAHKKTHNYSNIHVVQADILQPPFKPQFDVIFSVGVLHHLPDPEEGFLELVNYLQPKGIMAISVYSKENNEWIVKYLNPIRKKVLSKIPDTLSLLTAFIAAGLTYPATRLLYKPLNDFTFTSKWAKRHLFYNDFLYLLSHLGFKLTWGQFWDQLTAPTAFYLSRAEIEKWFEKASLKDITFLWRNGNCWNAVGEK